MSASGVRTIVLPLGERIPALGLGTWFMAEDPGAPANGAGRARARARPRPHAHRHRGDVRRRSRRGARRRGHRRAARRGLPGEQGAADERLARRHDRRLRAEPAAPRHGPDRSVPPALARLACRSRRPSTAFTSSSRPGRSGTGASATSTCRHGGAARRFRRVARARSTRCSTTSLAAASRSTAALVPRAGHSVMAYSPIEQGRLLRDNPALSSVAERHGATPAQIALAWVLRLAGVTPSRRRAPRRTSGEPRRARPPPDRRGPRRARRRLPAAGGGAAARDAVKAAGRGQTAATHLLEARRDGSPVLKTSPPPSHHAFTLP